MNRFFMALLTVLLVIGCADPDGKPDIAESNIEEQSDITEDTEITTAIETKTAFRQDLQLLAPGYVYDAYVTGYPYEKFTIEMFWVRKQWRTYTHMERFNPAVANRLNPLEMIEPSPTVITASLYHNGKAHFVGGNNHLVWKYQETYAVFANIRNAYLESWTLFDGKFYSKVNGTINDIIVNPNGGYFVGMTISYFEPSGNTYAVVGRVPDIDSIGEIKRVKTNGNLNTILLYNNRVVFFGTKDGRLFFSRFTDASEPAWWIKNAQVYYYDYPYKILDVISNGGFFLVWGKNKEGELNMTKFNNPYI